MTNLQLLLSIGVPSLLVVLSILQNNARFAAMDKRMDKAEADLRTFQAEHRQDIAGINADLRIFRNEHHQDLAAIHADLKQFYGMTTKLEGRMDEISKR
jgi:hypothetical protein